MNPIAFLILDDGSIWPGRSFGTPAPRVDELAESAMAFSGEVIFNTGMAGYHEILTDPSYTGQMVMMTYPHIGNYGDDELWSEIGPETGRNSVRGVKAGGLIVRSVYDGPVPAGRITLDEFLKKNGVCGITEVDTRALTLKFRSEGSRNGIIAAAGKSGSGVLGAAELKLASAYAAGLPSMTGLNLTDRVGTTVPQVVNDSGSPHVALLDCGVKMNIVRELTARNCRVSILPSDSTVDAVLSLKPDALLLSNGPGDPEPLDGPAEIARHLMGKLPLWGICLGHQILAIASGGRTYKMRFGHHGVNHPVRDEQTGRVFITSQNHGFAVDEESLPEGFIVRFRNANDGSVEGLENKNLKMLCVQHHPEAAPGPVDSAWIFDSFLETLKE